MNNLFHFHVLERSYRKTMLKQMVSLNIMKWYHIASSIILKYENNVWFCHIMKWWYNNLITGLRWNTNYDDGSYPTAVGLWWFHFSWNTCCLFVTFCLISSMAYVYLPNPVGKWLSYYKQHEYFLYGVDFF